jgi:hypothetical protein
MKVHYNKGMGIGFLVLGIILLVLACLTGGGGRNPFTGIMGFFEVWLGIAYLTRTYFSFDETKLEVYDAFMGSMIAKYQFQSLNEIEVEKGGVFDQVFLKRNGERQKMKISTWMVDKKDWQTFLQKINTVA